MAVKKGLVNSINAIQEVASPLYQQVVPIITSESGIETISQPLLQYPQLMNEFINVLVQKIAYSQVTTKLFNNPLQILEGDNIPLGTIGEEIYINPAEGREYNINDFAGLLSKYDADVKVQYQEINLDEQFPVTIIRQKLKQAFMSWQTLEDFITNITTSLYNGAYIRQYNATKELVSNAYRTNSVQISVVEGTNTKNQAIEFVRQARNYFLNFQTPSSLYNAWKKVGGYGRDLITWSNPEDIVFLIKNDVQTDIDIDVLAQSFNMSKTDLLGRIIGVDNFNIYDNKHNLIFDGSKILGIIADKSWFRIKTQDMFMEDFRNPNNRSIQYYLNLIKMYKYSLFANAVVFATELPNIPTQEITFTEKQKVVNINEDYIATIDVKPVQATDEITFKSSHDDFASVEKIDNRHCKVHGVAEGAAQITAKVGNVQGQLAITVPGAE